VNFSPRSTGVSVQPQGRKAWEWRHKRTWFGPSELRFEWCLGLGAGELVLPKNIGVPLRGLYTDFLSWWKRGEGSEKKKIQSGFLILTHDEVFTPVGNFGVSKIEPIQERRDRPER